MGQEHKPRFEIPAPVLPVESRRKPSKASRAMRRRLDRIASINAIACELANAGGLLAEGRGKSAREVITECSEALEDLLACG